MQRTGDKLVIDIVQALCPFPQALQQQRFQGDQRIMAGVNAQAAFTKRQRLLILPAPRRDSASSA